MGAKTSASVWPDPSLIERSQKRESKAIILDELNKREDLKKLRTENPQTEKEMVREAGEDKEKDTERRNGDGMFASPDIVMSCPLTPPLGVLVSSESQKKRGYICRVLGLLQSFGGDLSALRVPVHFNLPKSQLQLYGESLYSCHVDYLSACDTAESPLDRFLAVLTWHLSTTRQPPFGKAPYNPVLGETHHVSSGDLNVLLEQVSHHPPISALHATNEKRNVRMTWWQQPQPKFYGSSLEVDIKGSRKLFLDNYGETYDLCSPRLTFQFLPSPLASWLGVTEVTCPESNFKATISFTGVSYLGLRGTPNSIKGEVIDTKSGEKIYDLSGRWDRQVIATSTKSGEERKLYDSAKALHNLKAPQVTDPTRVSKSESVVVWSKVTKNLLDENWVVAGNEKNEVEEEQRRVRKERVQQNILWAPKHFIFVDGNWVWRETGKGVDEGPIKIP